MRLDKFICKSTELTKAQAIQKIHAGEVSVNGVVSGVGDDRESIVESTQVHENNIIVIDHQRLILRPFRYLLLHKPAGTICSNSDEKGYPSLFNSLQIDAIEELHIAGRLDVDTTGLVLITDDGRWTYNITVPTKQCVKIYRVGLSSKIAVHCAEALIAQFKLGIQLQGEAQLTLPARLEIVTENEVLLTIVEGKYHQVKRMLAAVDNKVVELHREQIGNIKLDENLAAGEYRLLTAEEIKL